MSERFIEISPADFFYRNRDLAGFNSPSRAIYAAVRELVENSLDACELYQITPNIFLRLSLEADILPSEESMNIYRMRVMDNGSGIPPEFVPAAFGQILFGSKYSLRQVRGTFGLGGKMAILYGQITTHGSATIISSTGTVSLEDVSTKVEVDQDKRMVVVSLDMEMLRRRAIGKEELHEIKVPKASVQVNEKTLFIRPEDPQGLKDISESLADVNLPSGICEFEISIDIQQNRPRIRREVVRKNPSKWHGTIVEYTLEGDYLRAMPKILEYLRQTAMVNPYAEITFIDPRGRLYYFERVTEVMPSPPRETLPHPHGCDVETLQRIINTTDAKTMLSFMVTHFHRVGEKTAKTFLEAAKIPPERNPKKLTSDEIVRMVQAMKTFADFLPPDASCLSPLGEELLVAGIKKELKPEFVAVEQRNPSAYSGYPFIVEVAIAYGGEIPVSQTVTLYRFANRIPLLYDEASDISRIVVNEQINWRHYKVTPNMPVAVIVHICSTKVPYKTVGKEFIADRPEVEREIRNGINSVARRLALFLTRKISVEHERKRIDVFSRYLPKVAKFSSELAGEPAKSDAEYERMVKPLLQSLIRFGSEG
ncbi:MAG: DNA topoisomerase VI subunit B [Candidatus Bathyarchaeia archaeon]